MVAFSVPFEGVETCPPLFPFKGKGRRPLISILTKGTAAPSFPFEGQLANRPCLGPHIAFRGPRSLSLRVGKSRAAPVSRTKRTMERGCHRLLRPCHALDVHERPDVYPGVALFLCGCWQSFDNLHFTPFRWATSILKSRIGVIFS